MQNNTPAFGLALVAMSLAPAVMAETTQQPQPSIFDKIWAVPKLYQNDDNSVMQSFSLIGRYHGQYWMVRAEQGDDQGWENRRMIAGFDSQWFENFKFQAQINIATDQGGLGHYYDGIYVIFVKWTPNDTDFSLSVGRLDYLFTGMERSTSSNRINTIERGLLVNQVMPGEVVGAHAKGKNGKFSYQGGVFSGSTDEEFSDFNDGTAAVIGGGYDTDWFGAKGILHLDYLYNHTTDDADDDDDNAFTPYDHIVSLWHRSSRGRFALSTDLTAASGEDDIPNIWSFTLEPTWVLRDGLFASSDSLQLVFRYQFANSDEDNGLELQQRYEQEVTQGFGNRYQAIYTGLNYYIYGQKLKLMFGGEFADMEDDADDGGAYRGWTWFGAIRLYF